MLAETINRPKFVLNILEEGFMRKAKDSVAFYGRGLYPAVDGYQWVDDFDVQCAVSASYTNTNLKEINIVNV